MKKEIQNFEELESFLKEHNYTYPKIWKAKLKKIKRKERNSSTWKDYRITMYAGNRTLHCARVILEDMYSTGAKLHNKLETISDEKIHKLFSKYSLSADVTKKIYQEIMFRDKTKYFQKVFKKGGKSYFQRNLTQDALKFEEMFKLKIPKIIKLPKKKDTIIQIMEEDDYWNFRNIYLGKPLEDRNSKSIIRKEAQEYFKSVCTYINQPKYNKDFFISHSEKKMNVIWQTYWKFYLKVR